VAGTSGAEEQDQLRESRAWNNSIYLMMVVPYLAVTVVGIAIWRGLRQRDRQLERQAALALQSKQEVGNASLPETVCQH
jgi:hypothetical protein